MPLIKTFECKCQAMRVYMGPMRMRLYSLCHASIMSVEVSIWVQLHLEDTNAV